MKKWIPILAVLLCAVLLIAVIVGILQITKLMNQTPNQDEQTELLTVEAYFETAWPKFTPVAYDSQAQCVMLQKQLDVSFEQAESFGKECYEELALGHVDTMQLMLRGCKESCGVELNEISVSGLSSDGKIIYTVFDSGSMTACWEK